MVDAIGNEESTPVMRTGRQGDDEEEEDDDDDNIIITTERAGTEAMQQDAQTAERSVVNDDVQMQEQGQSGMEVQQASGFSQNQQQQPGFGNMNFNTMNGFNPMMAMQNGGMGMPNFGMNMPMMGEYHVQRMRTMEAIQKLTTGLGMPGMNMDPSMMFNGGFGGMGGMNDMSMMGMGMGGFGGMPNMGMGDPTAGFFGGPQGGYNSNFGNQMNQPFHNNRGFGRPYGRGNGRGRGPGFRGRGNFGFQNQNQNYMSGPQGYDGPPQQYMQQQQQAVGSQAGVIEQDAQPARRGSPSYEPMKSANDNTDNTNLRPSQPLAEGDQGAAADANDIRDADNASAEDDERRRAEENDAVPSQEDAGGEVVDGESFLSRAATECTVAEVQCDHTEHRESNANGFAQHVDNDNQTPLDNDVSMNGMDVTMYHDSYQNESQYQQQGFGFGPRGRGGFRGRGAFRGRGGGFGYGAMTEATDLTPTPAPPINAPSGPKAMREGKPNTGWYSRPQPTPSMPPAVTPQAEEGSRSKQTHREETDNRARSLSRSRSRSRHRGRKHRDDEYESEEEYRRRKKEERRKRKDRGRQDEEADGDDDSRKVRSRDESREDESSSRRHRHRDEDRSSRSHRDRSRDKRRHRHRSRSAEEEPSTNGDKNDRSRRKSKSDRKYEEDYDELDRITDNARSRKHSRREDDHERSSRHGRSSRDDDKGYEREREKTNTRQVIEPPASDEIGFKIKGSKSAAINPSGMAPPPSKRDRHGSRRSSNAVDDSPITLDPYAAERERQHQAREAKEQQRRRSTQSQGLGKRMTRDEDDGDGFEAPRGPKGDQVRGGGAKRRRERKMNVKYEDEVGDGYEEREAGRWR